MYILLAAATSFEIQPSIDLLRGRRDLLQERGPGPDSHEWGVLITGIGSVAATHSIMRQIGRRRPDIIIQAGIAGCFTGRPAGDVVVVEEEAPGDTGVWEGGHFKSLFDLGLVGKDTRPFKGGNLANPYRGLLSIGGLEGVRGITVNTISTDPAGIAWLQQNRAPVVESMEGAALHYCCLEEKVAFVQYRSISNAIGERDKTKWNFPAAIGNLNLRLAELVRLLDRCGREVIDLR